MMLILIRHSKLQHLLEGLHKLRHHAYDTSYMCHISHARVRINAAMTQSIPDCNVSVTHNTGERVVLSHMRVSIYL